MFIVLWMCESHWRSEHTNQLQVRLQLTTVKPLLTDTSLIRTPLSYGQFTWSQENAHTFFVKITSIIRTLYNTDNGHEISAPERKFIQTEPLYYGHSNDDSSYSTRFPVCHYISECDQLSHCSYDNSIMLIGKNYTIDM